MKERTIGRGWIAYELFMIYFEILFSVLLHFIIDFRCSIPELDFQEKNLNLNRDLNHGSPGL